MNISDNTTRRGNLVDCRVRVQSKKTKTVGLEKVEEWTDIGATEARPVRWRHAQYSQYQRRSAEERVDSAALAADDDITLRMDYLPGVDATCRVLLRGRESEPFTIVAAPENLHNQGRTTILRIRRTVAG